MSFFYKRLATVGYKELHIEAYLERFANTGAPHTLVDVRYRDEFAKGHMPGAVNIPLNELAERLHEIPHHPAVVVVCATGGCSHKAAELLAENGYSEVYNLADGTFGWATRGLPMER